MIRSEPRILFSIIFAMLFQISCSNNGKNSGLNDLESEKIRLVKINQSDNDVDEILDRKSIKGVKSIDSLFILKYSIGLENFKLGMNTPIEEEFDQLIKNENGQYIAVNIDNDRYLKYYDSMFSLSLYSGQHAVLVFLTNMYHISIKKPRSFFFNSINVGKSNNMEIGIDAPLLFYNQPNSTYANVGKEEALLLDFFLLNTTLSKDGYNVLATINEQQILIDDWAPYKIYGVKEDIFKIKLELIDSTGSLVESPFNSVERVVRRNTN